MRTKLIPSDSPFTCVCYVLGYVGVPLFVTLTGYLFLDRTFDKTYLTKYVKRNFLPLLVAFEIWNIVWYLCTKVPVLLEGDWYARPFGTVVRQALFLQPADSALWYLHLCVGLYLGIPIIAKVLEWLSGYGKNVYTIILAACLVVFGTIIPTAAEYAPLIDERLWMRPVIGLNIFDAAVWGYSVWMVYMVAGYAIKKGFFRKIPQVTLVSAIVVLVAICVGIEAFDLFLAKYANTFLVALSILSFELLDRTQDGLAKRDTVVKALARFSKHAFPTYMNHLWVASLILFALRMMGASRDVILALPHTPNAFVFIAFIIVWFFACCLVTKLISYIPGAKKWVLLWK